MKHLKRIYALAMCLTILYLAGCASLLDILKQSSIQKPTVSFTNAKLTALSFDQADLLFDIKINNPNNAGITLAGFDYDFIINQNSFLSGNRNEQVSIVANGENTIQLPVELKFVDIYNTFAGIQKNDSSVYEIKCGLKFNLPVLGDIRIPITKSGTLPLLKLPSISLHAIKLDNINFTGADLNLEVKLNNLNAFSLLLDKFSYNLNINGLSWIRGKSENPVKISEKNENIIKIPLSLSFLKMGTSVYQLIQGGKNLNYEFTGDLGLSSSLDLLKNLNLPFDKNGTIDLIK